MRPLHKLLLLAWAIFVCVSVQAQEEPSAKAGAAATQPIVNLCGNLQGPIAKDILLDCYQLQVADGKDTSVKITGFTFYFVPKDSAALPYMERATGSKFTQGMIGQLTKMKSEDMVVVTEVECMFGSTKKVLNGPSYTVE